MDLKWMGVGSDDREPTHWVYILQLVEERYYIGSTKDLDQRYEQHLDGVGSEWTSRYPPIEVKKSLPCQTLGEALLTEDAVTLWTMAYAKYPSLVRGGRLMKEGHKHIYGVAETKRVVADDSLSKDEKRDTILDIVKWTIPDHSWYWGGLFKSYPKMKKNKVCRNLGKMPLVLRQRYRPKNK